MSPSLPDWTFRPLFFFKFIFQLVKIVGLGHLICEWRESDTVKTVISFDPHTTGGLHESWREMMHLLSSYFWFIIFAHYGIRHPAGPATRFLQNVIHLKSGAGRPVRFQARLSLTETGFRRNFLNLTIHGRPYLLFSDGIHFRCFKNVEQFTLYHTRSRKFSEICERRTD